MKGRPSCSPEIQILQATGDGEERPSYIQLTLEREVGAAATRTRTANLDPAESVHRQDIQIPRLLVW